MSPSVHVLHIHNVLVLSVDVNTAASNCTTGEVNLVGSDDGDEGRLEVCVNGAWGTVCSDGFDSSDAAVACEALGGFDGSGKHCFLHT